MSRWQLFCVIQRSLVAKCVYYSLEDKFMKFFSTLFAIGLLALATGCASTPKSFDQAMLLIDKAAEIAERQGTAYNATVRWNGKLGGSWIQRAELDSGVTVEITFHGNAAERAAVNKPNQ